MDKLIKAAKQFTKRGNEGAPRPELTGVYIADGFMTATNGFVACKIRHSEAVASPYVHYFTNDEEAAAEGRVYPDIRQWFSYNNAPIFSLTRPELKRLKDMADMVKALRVDAAMIRVIDGVLYIAAVSEEAGTYTDKMQLNGCSEAADFKRVINVNSLRKVIVLAEKMKVQAVDVRASDSVYTPVHFDGGDIETVISPLKATNSRELNRLIDERRPDYATI